MRAAAFAFCLMLVPLAAGAQTTVPRPIDPLKSTARFTIAHIFVEHVTGTVPIVSGTVELPPDSVVPVKVTAVLDASKIKSGDPDRDGSLESPDYFDTKQFPTWTFTSTKIAPTGPASFGMDGNLTLHGITNPVHMDVTVRGDAAHPLYHAVAQVDRRIWGMKGTRLDPVIGTSADITLDIALQ